MTSYEYDAFGNPLGMTMSGAQQMAGLSRDGMYDPLLAACYRPAGPHRPAPCGLFTEPDNPAGEASDPANLQRYQYASQTPVDRADPA